MIKAPLNRRGSRHTRQEDNAISRTLMVVDTDTVQQTEIFVILSEAISRGIVGEVGELCVTNN